MVSYLRGTKLFHFLLCRTHTKPAATSSTIATAETIVATE